MKQKLYLKNRIIAAIIFVFIFAGNALSLTVSRVPIYQKIDEADLVIIGIVKQNKPIFQPIDDIHVKGMNLLVEATDARMLFDIEVETLLFLRKSEFFCKKGDIVKIIGPTLARTSIDEPYYKEGDRLLFFLKIRSNESVKKYNLPEEKYFERTEGVMSVLNFSKDKEAQFAERVKIFCDVKNIKDENERIKAWLNLINSGDFMLQESAMLEIKRSGVSVKKINDRYEIIK